MLFPQSNTQGTNQYCTTNATGTHVAHSSREFFTFFQTWKQTCNSVDCCTEYNNCRDNNFLWRLAASVDFFWQWVKIFVRFMHGHNNFFHCLCKLLKYITVRWAAQDFKYKEMDLFVAANDLNTIFRATFRYPTFQIFANEAYFVLAKVVLLPKLQ